MPTILQTLHYLRLRLTVGLIRLLLRIRQGRPSLTGSPHILHLPSRDPTRTIPAHLYLPPDAPAPTPLLLNFHGSGFVLPMHGSDSAFCAHVAAHTPYAVLDVAYRLAPEHPFPAALHDAQDALAHVRARPAQFDAARLSVSGFSAGANLALALALAGVDVVAGDGPAAALRCAVAFYPPTDLARDPAAKVAPDAELGRRKAIPPALARVFDACYMPDGVRRDDPRVSPSYFVAGQGRWPREVAVLTGAGDSLALEAEGLAGRLEREEEGVRVTRRRWEGVGHAWDKGAKEGSVEEKARDEAYAVAVEVLRRSLDG